MAYELTLPASMSRMFKVFCVLLLKLHKDGCGGAAPLPAELYDVEVESKIQKVLAHHNIQLQVI